MPSILLPVPHFEQAQDGMCLPVCVQMVLAYWRSPVSETKVVKILGTKAFGTPISSVERLRQLGYQVEFGSLTIEDLKTHLIASRPVITRVWTAMLDYWETITSHVVVVVGFDDTHVYLNDPAISEAPQSVLWDGFLAAWAEFDETAAAIYPS